MRKTISLTLAIACLAPALLAQKPEAALVYAVILSRHGVRAPTWTPDRLNQYSNAPWPDFGVPPGNLTVHGYELMRLMGAYYRERFSSLASECAAPKTWIRADTDQRALETGRALAEGLLPGCKLEVHSAAGDALFDPIEAGLAQPDAELAKAAVAGRIGPNLNALADAHREAFLKLDFILNGDGKARKSLFDEPFSLTAGRTGVALSGPLSTASTLTENLLLEYTDGMKGAKLGWGRLNAGNLREVLALHTAYAALVRRTSYLARLRGSNMLQHIARSLEQAATGKPVKDALGTPATKLLVIAGHDTNISNLSGMLGLSWVMPGYQPDDVPPGGALVFTLWKSGAGYSVRLQFVTQTMDQMHDTVALSPANPPSTADLFIPACSAGTQGYPCSWQSFGRVVGQAALSAGTARAATGEGRPAGQ